MKINFNVTVQRVEEKMKNILTLTLPVNGEGTFPPRLRGDKGGKRSNIPKASED